MGSKDKPYNSGTMTQASFFSWIRSGLRRLSIRWKPKNEALAAVRQPYTGLGKRSKWEYKCAGCSNYYIRAHIECDHIIAVGTLKDFSDLPGFVERLFCESSGYRILCKPCHLIRTHGEKK